MKSSDFNRSDRLSDQIRTEIATILRNEVKDPRLEGITIIKVELSKDISKAYIIFSSLNSFTQISSLEVLLWTSWTLFSKILIALKYSTGFIDILISIVINKLYYTNYVLIVLII